MENKKNILGLDLGTNSIGFAVIQTTNLETIKDGKILISGSRIIPMDATTMGNFERGNTQSQTAERTRYRGIRRIIERRIQRRERLHRVLNILGYLPDYYAHDIDFEAHPGMIITNREPKLAWHKNDNGVSEFRFIQSFNEMMMDFTKKQPELVTNGLKVPYDWTIYYLRKKALTEKISGEELAWVLLNFNQKRGYYQIRGEEDNMGEHPTKTVEYYSMKVVDVVATDNKKGKDIWYDVHLENGWIYRRPSSQPLDWIGKTKDFIITTDINEDGTPKINKYGEPKRSFRAPAPEDWTLKKKKTEKDIEVSGKTVGSYIYDMLLANPKQKIIGELIRTIERTSYKDELTKILECQIPFHPELQDKEIYNKCIDALYPSNEAHKSNISRRDFFYLFRDDIIFYQRPLKSKKSLIDNCPYEFTQYVDKETGEIKDAPVKCIAKSNPIFQEFRLWQFVTNIRIYQKQKEVNGKLKIDEDVTEEFFKTEDDYVQLFEWLNCHREIDETGLLKSPLLNLKKHSSEYRWNYVSDKMYPCNTTRNIILTGLKKAEIEEEFLDKEKEMILWHILYSISDPTELSKALNKFAIRYNLNNNFVEAFRHTKPFDREYGSYSAKAIKKLLPLIRMGKYWKFDEIDNNTKSRIKKIICGDLSIWSVGDNVKKQLLELNSEEKFKGLSLHLACYVVYGRHSESKIITKWQHPEDINTFLHHQFQHGSLRNPIVEQIITETLRVVQDIWKSIESNGQTIDEIHLEMGREMKKTAKERERIAMQISENETTNLRIKMLLSEFASDTSYGIENIRPKSPSQQELFRIFEDDVLSYYDTSDIEDIIKTFRSRKIPSKSDILRYRLWLEQKYCSPYTGEIIPLSKLFTPAYEIEHIIPQSRYFDDSFNNKVICESDVNKLKDKQLGFEFIKNHHGQKVASGNILYENAYEKFVKDHYANSKAKMKRLLMEDIPDDFIKRQMNDSRYIVNYIKTILSNIVRDPLDEGGYEREAISKHIITSNGQITDRLKRDWGINDIWNEIIYHRFERLNSITNTTNFGHWENREGKRFFLTDLPIELQPGFRKKRIDHRHHAMDAIIIACTTRNIVNYLNNAASLSDATEKRPQLQLKVCDKILGEGGYNWRIKKPEGWNKFNLDIKTSLLDIVVTFKQNLRIINRISNYYQHYDNEGNKVMLKQIKGDSWAIRKPMHKETIFGLVNIRKKKNVRLAVALKYPTNIVDKQLRMKVKELIDKYNSNMRLVEKCLKENAQIWKFYDPSKIEIYYFTNDVAAERIVAVRKPVDTSFTKKEIMESVTDTGIQKILLRHLESKSNDPQLAFSPDGIDEMNHNIISLNNGKSHQPIIKVRKMELLGNKFNIGENGNKTTKYVIAEKGTNLFFAVYSKTDGSRVCDSIPLNIVIEREKEGLTPVPEKDAEGNQLLFYLTPNQLIYIPSEEELAEGIRNDNIDIKRIYKVVSFTGGRLHGIPATVANVIVDKVEFTILNKMEFTDDKVSLKSVCLPIKIDRLGEIKKIGYL